MAQSLKPNLFNLLSEQSSISQVLFADNSADIRTSLFLPWFR